MPGVPASITGILISIIIGLLVFIAKNLKTVLDKLVNETALSEKRHGIHDLAISIMLKDNYNSKAIAEDKDKFPFKFKEEK